MSIAHIADTARWMAYVRAVESDRPDALFRDPYSRQLAGDLGESIARDIGHIDLIANAIATRTAVLDRLILQMVARDQVDLVLNIGCGLDTRPWRLELPGSLRWVDVDLPALLDHKAQILPMHHARCRYEALAADFLDRQQRAGVLAQFPTARSVLTVTEGLLVYLSPAQVVALARDLGAHPGCQWWLTDLMGLRALQMLRQAWASKLASSEFRFAPADSVEFFRRLGWREHSFHSAQEEARRLNRSVPVPLLGRLLFFMAGSSAREELRRLAGVALFAREPDSPGDITGRGRSQ
jgi:methyltransferase (TIGR00027 family)